MASARKPKREGNLKGSPTPVGTALQQLAHALGIAKTLSQYDILTSWEKAVGAPIARVTKPLRIENRVLYVSVGSAPWRAELTMKRLEIIRKINRFAGTDVIQDIRFR